MLLFLPIQTNQFRGPLLGEHVVKTVIIRPDLFQHSYTANVNKEERKLTNDKRKLIK
jgi:hypothetical protein